MGHSFAHSTSTFCPGDSVAITATPGFASYLWSNGDTHPAILVSQPGDYWVTVTDNNGFQYTSDTISLNQFAVTAPVISQSGDTLISTPGLAYQWFNLLGPIIGANSQNYIPPASGQYTVSVIDSNGCEAESGIYVFVMNGINDITSENVTVLQNKKSVEVKANERIERIDIFDVRGEKIYSDSPDENHTAFNLAAFANGTYILVLKLENRSIRKMISLVE